MTFKDDEISARIELPRGGAVVLVDRLGRGGHPDALYRARNVFRIDSRGKIAWTVHSAFDEEGNPFTALRCIDGTVTAYRWDGGSYAIDLDSGAATPLVLER